MNKRVMKDSGIEWMGKIPSHWEVVKLNHKYRFHTGFTPDTKKEDYYSIDGFDWLTIGDLSGAKVVTNSTKKITELAIKNSKGFISTKGSLLYSFKLSVGQVAFAGKDIYTNEAIATFPITENPCVKFLYYSSQVCIIKNAIENIYGAKLLNQELIKSAKMVYPPLHEQQAIATYLDEQVNRLDQLIEDQQQVIEDWKAYKQSLITEVVTKGLNPEVELKDSGIEWMGEIPSHWEVVKLNHKYRFHTGFTPDTKKEDYYSNDGFDWLTIGDLSGTKIVTSSTKKITELAIKKTKGIISPKGSMLYSFKLSVGQVAFAGKDVYTNEAIATFPITENPCVKFLYYSSQVCIIKNAIENIYGAKLLNQELIKSAKMVYPPLHEQQQIADFLDEKCLKIDQLIEDRQHLIEDLKAYKQSLIYECVTGKKEIV